MSEELQKKIFSENLIRILAIKGKTQKEVADAIGVSPQTFNTWCQGIALPRMGKLQRLSDYLMVSKSDLLEKSEDKGRVSSAPILSDRAVQVAIAYDAADERARIAAEVALGIDFEKEESEVS